MSTAHIPAALRRLVYEQALGRCEYCLIPEDMAFAAHEIDHIIAEKHGGPTEAENLALSCIICNKHKGSDLASIDPASNEITPLFHPRRDRWADHFSIDQALIVGRTATGRATVSLMRLNRQDRVAEREQLLAAGALPEPE